jgi:hypothetical protein
MSWQIRESKQKHVTKRSTAQIAPRKGVGAVTGRTNFAALPKLA